MIVGAIAGPGNLFNESHADSCFVAGRQALRDFQTVVWRWGGDAGETACAGRRVSEIQLKRAYDPAGPQDGTRILVDRLWPRGLSRSAAKVDQWLKEVAPSTELRRWFGHDPAKWIEFRRRYEAELAHNPILEELRAIISRDKRVTLLFGARDAAHNNAVVLREVCRRH